MSPSKQFTISALLFAFASAYVVHVWHDNAGWALMAAAYLSALLKDLFDWDEEKVLTFTILMTMEFPATTGAKP